MHVKTGMTILWHAQQVSHSYDELNSMYGRHACALLADWHAIGGGFCSTDATTATRCILVH